MPAREWMPIRPAPAASRAPAGENSARAGQPLSLCWSAPPPAGDWDSGGKNRVGNWSGQRGALPSANQLPSTVVYVPCGSCLRPYTVGLIRARAAAPCLTVLPAATANLLCYYCACNIDSRTTSDRTLSPL